MMTKTYQRRHLRAPFYEDVLFADGDFVLKAKSFNLSERGILLGELPKFPDENEVPLMFCVKTYPMFKNFSLTDLLQFNEHSFQGHVVRVKARMVREEIEKNITWEELILMKFGLEFVRIERLDQQKIDEYVASFASNLVYFQALIDAFNRDDQTKNMVKILSKILGYGEFEKITTLKNQVLNDYKNLTWL